MAALGFLPEEPAIDMRLEVLFHNIQEYAHLSVLACCVSVLVPIADADDAGGGRATEAAVYRFIAAARLGREFLFPREQLIEGKCRSLYHFFSLSLFEFSAFRYGGPHSPAGSSAVVPRQGTTGDGASGGLGATAGRSGSLHRSVYS